MKLRTVAVLLLLLAACGKTSDVAAMQDEANGLAASYKARLDGLWTRFRDLDERSKRLPPNAVANAPDFSALKQVAGDANTRLNDMRNLANNAPATITAAAKAENSRAELIRVLGDLRTKLEAGHTEVNSKLDTIESWIAYLELRPAAPSKEAPPPPPAVPAPDSPPPAGAPANRPPQP